PRVRRAPAEPGRRAGAPAPMGPDVESGLGGPERRGAGDARPDARAAAARARVFPGAAGAALLARRRPALRRAAGALDRDRCALRRRDPTVRDRLRSSAPAVRAAAAAAAILGAAPAAAGGAEHLAAADPRRARVVALGRQPGRAHLPDDLLEAGPGGQGQPARAGATRDAARPLRPR